MSGNMGLTDQLLCEITKELQDIKKATVTREKRDTDIFFFVVPEAGGTRSFSAGTTHINFKNGVIQNPDGSLEYLELKLDSFSKDFCRSISIEGNQSFDLRILPMKKRTIDQNYMANITYLQFTEIEITCTVTTNIKIFACTNPEAVVNQFKVMTVSQTNIDGDSTEAQTWDTVTSLITNLNRIRKKLNDIIGGTSWSDAAPTTLTAVNTHIAATAAHGATGAVVGTTNTQSLTNKTLDDTNPIQNMLPVSYIVYKDGSTYKARNATTGVIDYSGTNAATVINNALGAISSGIVLLKNGTYTLTAAITINATNKGIKGEGA